MKTKTKLIVGASVLGVTAGLFGSFISAALCFGAAYLAWKQMP